MNVLIENYRGWEISFNPDEEAFVCASDIEDKQEKKRSFTSCKKCIDDFIKDNNQFKSIEVIKFPSRYDSLQIIKLVGIRKDGRFVYNEKGKDKNEQLSDYYEKDYCVYNPLVHDKIIDELKILENERNAISTIIDAKQKEFTGIPLSEIKAKYTI